MLFLAVGALTIASCYAPMVLTESDADIVLTRQEIAGPSPADPGPYQVGTMYYGSGTDVNRPEYRDSVTIVTDSVDASKLVQLGGQTRSRNEYWGFSTEGFPLNGRVWYPEGEGTFPLVLVVHGNHDPTDYSDPGYDYLGEVLASRGFILVSVDMNFINGTSGENDGRGWMLLKHLEAWKGFNEDSDNPFFGMVDMENLAVMGHSRGGEAVSVAAAFNRLSHYPDNASLTFDFNFNLKSLVAIAPVDGQYLPTDRGVPLQDVNYLVFHGSHDGDVSSFHGLRQWNRVTYPNGGDYFKSAVYMYRANHGQWNTVWNSFDNGPRSARRLDLRYLVPREDQRRMAEIYISSFLEITLKGEDRWRPIFRDHRVIGEWLPETMYVTQFQDASFQPLATFEEDIDVTTGSMEGVVIRGDSLSTWREGKMDLRSRNRANTSASQENQAIWLGWNNNIAGSGDRTGPVAQLELELPAGAAARMGLDGRTSIDLQLVVTGNEPRPRANPDEADENEESPSGNADQNEEADNDANEDDEEAMDEDAEPATSPALDLSIEIEDASGRTARVGLSEYGAIREPLEIRILRRQDQEAAAVHSEMVLQSFHIPLSDFGGINAGQIRAVRLVFDRSDKGEVVVDNIGFSRMDPAAWSARVRN